MTQRNIISRAALSLSAAVAALALVGTPQAHAQGLFGIGEMVVGGSLQFGERLGGGGFGLSAHFEYAAMGDQTALGNWMGFEFVSELGYEKYKGQDPYGGDWTMGPLLFDLALGFPLTLVTIGDGGTGTTIVSFALGAGLSAQHVYGYVRGRILTALSETAYLELMGRWTPSEASADGTDKTGLDLFQLRGSAYFEVDPDLKLQVFAEWTPADRARVGAEDPANLSAFPRETETSFQDVVRVGVGVVF